MSDAEHCVIILVSSLARPLPIHCDLAVVSLYLRIYTKALYHASVGNHGHLAKDEAKVINPACQPDSI